MSIRLRHLSHHYDQTMYEDRVAEYYGGTDFYNFGYWLDETRTQAEACENLMERLLAFIPRKTGTILDVACGLGGTTKHLLRYYEPSAVTALNISQRQLETSRSNVPGCRFVSTDACQLAFADGAFDNLICVEAAFHFDTREDFVREAYRVLRAGGRLVLSDILVSRWAARWNPRLPRRNWVRDLAEYRCQYMRAGFRDVEVIDATAECWTGFYTHFWRWRRERFRAGEIGGLRYARMCLRNLVANAALRYYLLVSATKA